MREYELTYLSSDEVGEEDLNKVTGKVTSIIGGVGGKAKKEEAWGRRKLVYPIKKQNFATYVTLWFELPKEKITNVEHELRVNSLIIRHLITLRVEKGEKLVVSKEEIADTGDVEAILGEKSFEMVEGETKESRDLMARRITKEPKNLKTPTTQLKPEISSDKTKVKVEEEKKTVEPKPKKKTVKKVKKGKAVEPKLAIKEVVEKPVIREEVVEEKPVEAKEEPKEKIPEDEADRRKKLDEKLDELLKDDL